MRFDLVLENAGESPVDLEWPLENMLACGATSTVFRTFVDGDAAVVKRIENIVDVAQTQWQKNAPAKVNVKNVMDAEVALHAQVSALGVCASPALYGVVRLKTGNIEVHGKEKQRWTYFLFMEYVAGETLRQFLWRKRGCVQRADAAALLEAVRNTCLAFSKHGLVVGDRMNPDNIIVRERLQVAENAENAEKTTYELVFIDFQNAKKCSDMFTRPAWLICVACASTEHACDVNGCSIKACAVKGGTVIQSARRIYAELTTQTDDV
jgi:tRNA A-37 threonylcarbamoyl transferase component Bud32